MKAVKDAFKVPASAGTSDAPAAKSAEPAASPFTEDLAAKRIHERNAAFLKGLDAASAEAPADEKQAAGPAGQAGSPNGKLLEILKTEDALLDNILKEQGKLHKDVKKRNWDSLQATLERLRKLSDNFVLLDGEREKLVGDNRKLYFQDPVEPVFTSLRSKLTKSKIENEALRSYVSTTKEFIGNVLEECYQKESSEYSAYSANGSKVKGEFGSMLVNTDF